LAVSLDPGLLPNCQNSLELLIKLTSTVVQATHRAYVSLVDGVVFRDQRVRRILPVVAEEDGFIGSPSCEAVHHNDRVIVLPVGLWQVIEAEFLAIRIVFLSFTLSWGTSSLGDFVKFC